MLDRRFWLNHAGWPALFFVLFATVAAATSLDEGVARAWAFDPVTGHFIGDGAGQWWAKDLIHSMGGRVIRIIGGLLLLWALTEFGGQQPYVRLFADRPEALPPAQCFPGGHSSSGFALFALYFLCLGRSRRRARWALAAGLLVGGVFAFGQEARGAHFLSHDLWSAALVWFACLWVYVFGYRGVVWEPSDAEGAANDFDFAGR